MFERPSYTVSESSGDVPDLIQVVRDIPTELEYKFNISLRTGDFPATEGESQYTSVQMNCHNKIIVTHTHTITTLTHATCTHPHNSHMSHTHTFFLIFLGADFVFMDDFIIFFQSDVERLAVQ